MYDFNMNLLDVLLNNIEYNKTHPNNKRSETILRHYRICGKNYKKSNKVRLFELPKDVQNFFIESAKGGKGIKDGNYDVYSISDMLSAFDPSNIEFLGGKKISDIIERINTRISQDTPYHNLTELQYKIEDLGKAISLYLSSNFNKPELDKVNTLIDNYNKGIDTEFYIIMFPEINDENIDSVAKSYNGRILFPDDITIYSDAQKEYIKNKIMTEKP